MMNNTHTTLKRDKVFHTLEPIFNANSRILILGTMPSPKSRETGFYYNHPQNRFWPVLAAVFGETLPVSNEEKRELVLRHGIALWDVLSSCDIIGAGDASIRNPVVNDIGYILQLADIQTIFTTGKKASDLYRRHIFPRTKRESIALPSTSAANAQMRLSDLIEAYRVILSA